MSNKKINIKRYFFFVKTGLFIGSIKITTAKKIAKLCGKQIQTLVPKRPLAY